MTSKKRRAVTIFEFGAIVSVLSLAAFLGFTYVNGQQKLASTQDTVKDSGKISTKKTAITPQDIKPIENKADLGTASAQLDAMQNELTSSESIHGLTENLDSIIN